MFIRFLYAHKAVCCLFLLLMCSPSVAGAQGTDVIDSLGLRKMNILFMEITTVNGEAPTCEFDTSYWGAKTVINAVEVPGRMVLSRRGELLYDSGDYIEDKQGMTIRIRGNSSAVLTNKKPYRLKLQKKADLFFRGKDKYRDRNWVLLKDGPKPHPILGLYVNQQVGLQWTPRCEHVNLVLNGEYRGLYYLIESVRNSEGRLLVDDDGFIAEYDQYYWTQDVYLPGNFDYRLMFTFKYPDAEDFTPERLARTNDVLQRMQRSFDDGTYPEYVDVESFASWLLGQDIVGSYDARGSNTFLTKYDDSDDSKIMMGNLWDFDDNMSESATEFVKVHREYSYFFPHMFDSNPALLEAYVRRWKELRDSGFMENIFDLIDSLDHDPNKPDINTCITYERSLSPDKLPYLRNLNSYLTKARNFYNVHLPWLNDTITRLDPAYVHIGRVDKSAQGGRRLYYNLLGVPQQTPYMGEVNIVVEPDGRRRKVLMQNL